jgi:3-oxoadipate enol-lactonase
MPIHDMKKNIKITLNQLTVSYNDYGPAGAPVVIFIHGFPFNKSTWEKQAAALQEKYRVITYDIRGHGDSDAGEADFSIGLFADDLFRLMDALQIDQAVLCGLSMGGYIALQAVTNYPERFKGLILCDTQCIADTPEGKEKRMKTIETIRANGLEKYADDSVKNLFAPESFTTRKSEINLIRDMILNTSLESVCNALLALAGRKETCSRLEKIYLPVLILVGKEDKITPPAASEYMHNKIRNSALVVIDHAGHLSNLENPEEFNKQLTKFLTEIYRI